jgi:hypothetical protein
MRRMWTLGAVAPVAIALLISLPAAPVAAQGAQSARTKAAVDADMAEISRYRLTETKLNKFVQATRNLVQTAKNNPDMLRNDEGRNMSNATLSQMAAFYDKHPPIKRALNSAGMTSREYVTFMLSMMQSGMAAWAMKQPGAKLPPGISRENIAFMDSHKEALENIQQEFKALEPQGESSDENADNDEDSDEDEEEEPEEETPERR